MRGPPTPSMSTPAPDFDQQLPAGSPPPPPTPAASPGPTHALPDWSDAADDEDFFLAKVRTHFKDVLRPAEDPNYGRPAQPVHESAAELCSSVCQSAAEKGPLYDASRRTVSTGRLDEHGDVSRRELTFADFVLCWRCHESAPCGPGVQALERADIGRHDVEEPLHPARLRYQGHGGHDHERSSLANQARRSLFSARPRTGQQQLCQQSGARLYSPQRLAQLRWLPETRPPPKGEVVTSPTSSKDIWSRPRGGPAAQVSRGASHRREAS